MSKRVYLEKLHSDQNFKQFILKDMESVRPVIPPHNPEEDNTEQWKAQSAMQMGFDLCATIIGVNFDE